MKTKWWYFGGLILFFFAIGGYFGDGPIYSKDLKLIKNVVLYEKPSYQETSGKYSVKEMKFSIKGYFNQFEIRKSNYRTAMRVEIMKDLNQGDTIDLRILLNSVVDLNSSDSLLESTNIEVFSVVKNGKEYYDLELRNRKTKESKTFTVIMFLSISLMSVFTGYLISKHDSKRK